MSGFSEREVQLMACAFQAMKSPPEVSFTSPCIAQALWLALTDGFQEERGSLLHQTRLIIVGFLLLTV